MKKKIENYFDRLFPLNRSITGKDYQKSLKILSEIIPLKKINFKSGQKVFDWKVPLEWNVHEAKLSDELGNSIIDFKNNNLHLIGYSIKKNSLLNFNELKKNLYFEKKLPGAIPYVTSYYKKRWGFCLSYNQYKALNKKIKYHVKINTTFHKGKLTVGEKYIKGKSSKEFLISSYLCHPSLANNELSGPLTLAFLYESLKDIKLKYSLRYVIYPETIGSISYISKFKKKLKKNVIGGYQLTCCGLNNIPNYKKSKKGNSIIDIAIQKNIGTKFNTSNFYPLGSDELRYNSIGIDINFGCFMRSNFESYKEYHTSYDNKKIINFKNMEKNIKILKKTILYLNNLNFYESTIKNCEPFLSKRKLYSNISRYNSYTTISKINECFFWLIQYSDGRTSSYEISEMSKININIVEKAAKILTKANLLKKL